MAAIAEPESMIDIAGAIDEGSVGIIDLGRSKRVDACMALARLLRPSILI